MNGLNLSLSDDAGITSDHIFQIKDIKHAVSIWKPNKVEACSSALTSDHVVNAGDDFMYHIEFLLTLFVVHGSFPGCFLSSTIIPILKGHHVNVSDCTHFRGITLSSLLGKIFDNIILDQSCDKLLSSELNSVLRQITPLIMCSMILKETISYYKQHITLVFCTFLDASKAVVLLQVIFKLLLKRQLPAHILSRLINLYTNRCRLGCHQIRWFFGCSWAQAGCSIERCPFLCLFRWFIVIAEKAGFGCYIGDHIVGPLAYADNIVLVAPSAIALRKMLAICEDYAGEFCMYFQCSKI